MLHLAQHYVVQDVTGNKYFVAYFDITKMDSKVKYTPSLFQNPKHAFYILLDTLYTIRKVSFGVGKFCMFIWTNQNGLM